MNGSSLCRIATDIMEMMMTNGDLFRTYIHTYVNSNIYTQRDYSYILLKRSPFKDSSVISYLHACMATITNIYTSLFSYAAME